MKLSEFCTTARRFVDGVCALPNVSSIATREVHRLERDAAASRQWLDAVDENRRLARQLDDALSDREAACANRDEFRRGEESALDRLHEAEQQLAAEREAHKELSVEYRKLAESNARTSSELSAARADLDALTRWRLQSEEPCPGQTLIVKKDHLGITHIYPCHLQPSSLWRHTPESLAALKQHDAERVWKP
jgi:chromosome segregation ATPase